MSTIQEVIGRDLELRTSITKFEMWTHLHFKCLERKEKKTHLSATVIDARSSKVFNKKL